MLRRRESCYRLTYLRQFRHLTLWIKVMKTMLAARTVLAQLQRCAAKARSTGLPCKNPGLGAGGRCWFHGGASAGRPPTHGWGTKQAKLARDWALLLAAVLAEGIQPTGRTGMFSDRRVRQLLRAH